MRFHHMARRIFLVPAFGLALAAAVTACSSSSSSSTTPATSASSAASAATSSAATSPAATSPSASGGSAATIATIKTNWEAFFSSSTPNSKRVALLQNGNSLASTVKAFSSSPLAAAVAAKVISVSVTSPTKATVKYDLTAAGQTVASNATGVAVLQDGVWKVGDASFCGLLKEGASILNIPLPSACK